MDVLFLKLDLFRRRQLAEENLRITLGDTPLILGRRVPAEHRYFLNIVVERGPTNYLIYSNLYRRTLPKAPREQITAATMMISNRGLVSQSAEGKAGDE
jgi:hypothetical protein